MKENPERIIQCLGSFSFEEYFGFMQDFNKTSLASFVGFHKCRCDEENGTGLMVITMFVPPCAEALYIHAFLKSLTKWRHHFRVRHYDISPVITKNC